MLRGLRPEAWLKMGFKSDQEGRSRRCPIPVRREPFNNINGHGRNVPYDFGVTYGIDG